jgi:autotransporter-associated beta strand protein
MKWPFWTRSRPARRRRPAAPACEQLESRIALSVALGLVPVGAQPQGALSGRIVYTSAGHGWQWNSTLGRWATDRPNLLSMVEDFGNQDQTTLYAEYLFQAGATVVPMRPIGRQLNEVVVDNDSPDVIWSGSWSNNTAGPRWYDEDYGATVDAVKYRFATVNASRETASATYAPAIPEAGLYPVYTWVPHSSNRTNQLYVINHSGGSTEVRVDHRRVGNGWVWLGSYHFDAGRSPERGSVKISNFSTAGGSVVIADAIRFGNGMGDVRWGANGIGSGGISGYPREDEGSLLWLWRGVGQSTSFSSPSSVIGTSNVSAPLRMAEHMNVDTNPYGTSIYVGFHSNATTGNPSTATARGAIGLLHSSNPTPNQASLATTMGRRLNLDMRALDGSFEHTWSTRTTYSLAGVYGEITNTHARGEFDATIVEVAFHDNTLDAELLRDPRVRDQLARSTYEATLEHFFNHPGTTLRPANVTLPSPPERVHAQAVGDGVVSVSWIPGPSSSGGFNGVHGSPATGFRVYASVDGLGFDGGTFVAGGSARSVTLTGLDPQRPYFFRVVAENAGGQSRPSEVLGVLPAEGPRQVLIVNGFDRLDRSQNFVQAYAFGGGGTTERVFPAFNNPRNQVVPTLLAIHAARPGIRVDSASNEAVIAGRVRLTDYEAVVWVLGNESTAGRTFDATEQQLVSAFITGGGHLLVSGSEVAYDLDARNSGRTFLRSVLGARYVADSAGTHRAMASAGGIFAGLANLRFSDGSSFSSLPDQTFNVRSPDVLAPEAGSQAALSYSGGIGGVAATYRPAAGGRGAVVVLGFPFESISGEEARAAVMGRVLDAFVIEAATDLMILQAGSGEQFVDATERSGPGQLVKRGPGTVILTAAASHSGGTVVEEGTLVVRELSALGTGTVEVRSGGRLVLDIGLGRVSLTALTLADGGRIDVGSGGLVVAAGGIEAAALRQALLTGRDGGTWNGPSGIVSRSVPPGSPWAVGYRIAADGAATVAWAALGDADLDGSVSTADINALLASGRLNSGLPAAAWALGDFDYDGLVTTADLNALLATGLLNTGPYAAAPKLQPTGSTQTTDPQSDAVWAFAALSETVTAHGSSKTARIGRWSEAIGSSSTRPSTTRRASAGRKRM